MPVDDPAGCDRFVAAHGHRARPGRAVARSGCGAGCSQCGMRPISLAVDVTNYVMLETGQPLHAFDRAQLTGPIVVRRARAGRAARRRSTASCAHLDPDDLVVTDDSGPIALAGVMGGASTEIAEATTDVVLEAAHFDAGRRSRAPSRRHQLPSEASRRFERGVDPDARRRTAADRVASCSSARRAGADAGVTDVDLRSPRAGDRHGGRLPEPARRDAASDADEVARAPRPQSAASCRSPATALTVTPPTWRPDLAAPADLVEEVVRLDGYDRSLPSAPPRGPGPRGAAAAWPRRRRVGRALAGAVYRGAARYPFVGDAASATRSATRPTTPRRRAVRLANPLSEQEP